MAANPSKESSSIDHFELVDMKNPPANVKFYEDVIAKRKPVVINTLIMDEDWHGNRWTNEYLKKKCGSELVRVEWRNSTKERFGQGNEKCMQFSHFIDLIDDRDETVYLTTQELSYNTDGQPSLISPPLTCLRDDFPLVPDLCKNLIVSNINMWFGSSSLPTTSGLHHDFHDNLYILLRGEKTFTLYSPAEAHNMYTVGEIVKVHPNGRINYKGQVTREDGADINADIALEAASRMEQAANKLIQVESGNGDQTAQQEAEDEIEDAMEALLDAECGSFDGDDNDDNDDDSDDDGSDIWNEEENEDEDASESGSVNSDGKRLEKTTTNDSDVASFLGIKRKNVDSHIDSGNSSKVKSSATSTTPSNFSQVDTKLSDAELSAKFPLFLEAKSRSVTVTLKAGQMLYLPAGWFHEVESKGNGAEGGHLAFNYWFHPPDNDDFERPYKSDFWARDFKDRLKSGNI